jgi:hypothetical protein
MAYRLFGMAYESKEPAPIGAIFLGLLAISLFSLAGVGYFSHQDAKVTGGLIFAGSILAVVAAFSPRIQGTLELGKDGAKILIEKKSRSR